MYVECFKRRIENDEISETVKIDRYTYDIIQGIAPELTFSEQLKKLVHEYQFMKGKRNG